MHLKHLGEHCPHYRSIILGPAASFTNICMKLTEGTKQPGGVFGHTDHTIPGYLDQGAHIKKETENKNT